MTTAVNWLAPYIVVQTVHSYTCLGAGVLKSSLLSASRTATWPELHSCPQRKGISFEVPQRALWAGRALGGLLSHTLALRSKYREKLHFNTRSFFCTWPLTLCLELKIGGWGGKRKDAHSREALSIGEVHVESPPPLPGELVSDPGAPVLPEARSQAELPPRASPARSPGLWRVDSAAKVVVV